MALVQAWGNVPAVTRQQGHQLWPVVCRFGAGIDNQPISQKKQPAPACMLCSSLWGNKVQC